MIILHPTNNTSLAQSPNNSTCFLWCLYMGFYSQHKKDMQSYATKYELRNVRFLCNLYIYMWRKYWQHISDQWRKSPTSGPWFNIKMPSYQYKKSHCGDKTILRPSYLHNGLSYTDKMISLYWIKALITSVSQRWSSHLSLDPSLYKDSLLLIFGPPIQTEDGRWAI